MRYFKPFICGCIGGACGALFASITQLGASGTGVTGLFGVLLCLNMPVQYILMMAISIGVSFALTWIFGYKDEEEQVKKVLGNEAGTDDTTEDTAIEEAKRGNEEKVMRARESQQRRFAGTSLRFNADLGPGDMDKYCPLGTAQKEMMERMFQAMGFSARAYHRIVKVARTIADVEGECGYYSRSSGGGGLLPAAEGRKIGQNGE